MALRRYPAPPTGHDLMAMFPPPSPGNFPVRPQPTSGYFEQEERAFFAQAGREIVRARPEVDPGHADPTKSSGPSTRPSRDSVHSPSWKPQQPSPTTPVYAASAASSSSRSRAGTVTSSSPSAVSLYHPASSALPNLHPPPSHPPPPPSSHPSSSLSSSTHGLRTPPQDHSDSVPPPRSRHSNPPPPPPDEYRDDPDEAWRRPMPYAERRRAGKHTRRVIVRN
ncbi:hypothetical protein K435DRAFT_783281 [Dendrothele bispora CBS 962.96]|uniref:Uncharacterized protein n=1 Tax=Dendrothele bispora (strain CBS 962.96) TaxID=1314807 RepID=A0A4S8L9S2_DENBC|nr:hypothetical protein K435DRAFT_783281 [Dendrothele bispora CBS 962.96]